MSDTLSPLHQLANHHGIIPEYLDQSGTELRHTSDETRVALLAAMGFDASTEERARAECERIEGEERRRLLAPVRVVTERRGGRVRAELSIPEECAGAAEWVLELSDEQGEVHRREGRARGGPRTMRVALPVTPGAGYHELRFRIRGGGAEREGRQRLIVTPATCLTPQQLLPRGRAFGITANLYTVRSERNWGVGDLTDLRELLRWTAEIGGEFVGVNPLHALRNRGVDISPYSPISRVYRNPIYLDVEAVPELAVSSEARALLASEQTRAELRVLRAGSRVDYERVWALKRTVLEALHRSFLRRQADGGGERAREYRGYLDEQGESITSFATFMALSEMLERRGSGAAWHEWPDELRDPASPAVAAFRETNRETVDFHRYLQFELDCQLAAAAGAARERGLAIGLYQDLAIGISPTGSDTWSYPHLFARGVSIGAPPDDYSSAGQNWGLPPLDPLRLREDGYRYWAALVRASLRHAGALRIDHILGLFRQFWIPDGMSGKDGAYVRFPVNDLLAILALESTRAGALVVGEDLGTVPREVPGTLKRWGILSSRVLYFERTKHGAYRAPARYEPLSLTTANTHDMPTLAGFWQGRDIELRQEVGLIETAAEAARASETRENDRRALRRALERAGCADAPTLAGAVHSFLCQTPAALVGLSLDDIVGETEPVNIPGVGPDRYPSWTRRLSTPLESLRDSPAVEQSLGCASR